MNDYIGYQQQAYNDYFNKQPSSIKGLWNADTDYNKRYLLNEIYSVFEFKMPEKWALNWFRFWLFNYGSIACYNSNKYGWIIYPYGIRTLDLYYQPKEIIISSPYLEGEQVGIIGKNAEIIKLFDDYYSIMDLVTRYATKLANIDKDIDIALMNSNIAYVFSADDKKQAEAIKEAYSKATQGIPLITINKDTLGNGIETMFPNVANNYIVNDLLQSKRTIINEFLTKIGIKNANYEKKERLNSQEVNENDDETRSIVSIMYNNIKQSFNKLNNLDNGLQLDVKYNYNYNQEGSEDIEQNNTIRNV